MEDEKQLIEFDPENIALFMVLFLKQEKEKENSIFKDASQLYPDLLRTLPVGVESPSLTDWLFIYNLCNRQKLIDFTDNAISINRTKLANLESDPETDKKDIRNIERLLRSLEDRYVIMTKDVIKYSNDAINRDKPKQLDVNHSMSIQGFNSFLDNAAVELKKLKEQRLKKIN